MSSDQCWKSDKDQARTTASQFPECYVQPLGQVPQQREHQDTTKDAGEGADSTCDEDIPQGVVTELGIRANSGQAPQPYLEGKYDL